MEETFGKRLKRLRETVGMNRVKFCETANLDYSTVEGWENRGHLPSLDAICASADVLSVSLDYLARGKEYSTQASPIVDLPVIPASLPPKRVHSMWRSVMSNPDPVAELRRQVIGINSMPKETV